MTAGTGAEVGSGAGIDSGMTGAVTADGSGSAGLGSSFGASTARAAAKHELVSFHDKALSSRCFFYAYLQLEQALGQQRELSQSLLVLEQQLALPRLALPRLASLPSSCP